MRALGQDTRALRLSPPEAPRVVERHVLLRGAWQWRWGAGGEEGGGEGDMALGAGAHRTGDGVVVLENAEGAL